VEERSSEEREGRIREKEWGRRLKEEEI